MSRARSLAALAGAALALAACSREAPPPVEDNVVEPQAPEPAPTPPPPVAAPAPPPAAAEEIAEPAPEPVDESAQTLDDADATGLTTRALPGVEDEDAPAADAAGGNSNE